MSKIAKMMQQASAGAGGAGLDVDEVFSTFLYDGTGSAQTITNNIDLSGEGGLVWVKSRTSTNYHTLGDTARGATKAIFSNHAMGEDTATNGYFTSFNSNGFTTGTYNNTTNNGQDFVSWTFRKAPKFFDVITYSGNSTAGRTISHNLGCTVGQVWVKRTNTSNNWACWHRGIANNQYLQLNSTNQAYSDGGIFWNNTTPTSTTVTLGADSGVNATGSTYVMYVFAHNNSDGEFGPSGNADIIKCGSYTGDGGAGTTEVNLGFEPQWILVKATSAADNWFIIDNMRGWVTHNNEANDAYLLPNAANSESTGGFLDITSTGFKTTLYSNVNVSGRGYIYMAIRRGPLAAPESASDVFDVDVSTPTQPYVVNTNLSYVDMTINRTRGASLSFISNRVTGSKWMRTDATNAETNSPSDVRYDFNGKVMPYFATQGTSHVNWMWKRAPSYFDVVAYTGDGGASTLQKHNLGVVPEMIWIKRRDSTGNWGAYHKALPSLGTQLYLDLDGSYTTSYGSHIAPTATQFCVGGNAVMGGTNATNTSGGKFIAYLFATVSGVSKVGSYNGTGSSIDIDCGFSNGAKFVLIKRANVSSGGWIVFDTERGIVAGNDPYLFLNDTNAEGTTLDVIDPLSSGFTMVSTNAVLNASGSTYIFYAIAA